MTEPVDLDALEETASGPLESSLYVPTEFARKYHLSVLAVIAELRHLRARVGVLEGAIKKHQIEVCGNAGAKADEELWAALGEKE